MDYTANLRFDEYNVNWTRDQTSNELFIKSVLNHMNNVLQVRGHVFLNDILDALRSPRTQFGQTHGWVYDKDARSYIDYVVTPHGEPPMTFYDITFSNCRDILDTLS